MSIEYSAHSDKAHTPFILLLHELSHWHRGSILPLVFHKMCMNVMGKAFLQPPNLSGYPTYEYLNARIRQEYDSFMKAGGGKKIKTLPQDNPQIALLQTGHTNGCNPRTIAFLIVARSPFSAFFPLRVPFSPSVPTSTP